MPASEILTHGAEKAVAQKAAAFSSAVLRVSFFSPCSPLRRACMGSPFARFHLKPGSSCFSTGLKTAEKRRNRCDSDIVPGSHAELFHFLQNLRFAFFVGALIRGLVLVAGAEGVAVLVQDEIPGGIHQGQIRREQGQQQPGRQHGDGAEAEEGPEEGVEGLHLSVGVGQIQGKNVEEQQDDELEGVPQGEVVRAAEQHRQLVGEGGHHREDVDDPDQQHQAHGVDCVTEVHHGAALVQQETHVQPTQEAQGQGQQPDDGGLLEIGLEAQPELLEGVQNPVSPEGFQHHVTEGGPARADGQHRQAEQDEHKIGPDDDAKLGHELAEAALIGQKGVDSFPHAYPSSKTNCKNRAICSKFPVRAQIPRAQPSSGE